MPELPEVETVRRGLAPSLIGARIIRAEVGGKGLRRPFPDRLAERLRGRTVTAIRRRAKYILMDMDDGWTLILHLGMSGRVLLADDDRPKARAHDHLVLHMTGGRCMTLNDPRRFGLCDLVRTSEAHKHELLRALGPEPLEGQGLARHLTEALRGKACSIKAALLDQQVVAGLGNIYVCEALFHAGLAPTRQAGSLDRDDIKRLVGAIRSVLQAAIRAGGSSLRDYVRSDGELGMFQHQFAVYDRAGKSCPGCDCDASVTGGIRRIVQSGRSSYFCPRKQTDGTP